MGQRNVKTKEQIEAINHMVIGDYLIKIEVKKEIEALLIRPTKSWLRPSRAAEFSHKAARRAWIV